MFIIGYYDNQGKCIVESYTTSKDFAIKYCTVKNLTYENRDYFYKEVFKAFECSDWYEIVVSGYIYDDIFKVDVESSEGDSYTRVEQNGRYLKYHHVCQCKIKEDYINELEIAKNKFIVIRRVLQWNTIIYV